MRDDGTFERYTKLDGLTRRRVVRTRHLLPGADRQAVAKLETFATAPSAATVTDLAHARARLRGEQGERS